MDRFTKLVLTGWTCAAILFQTWLLHDAWPELPLLAGSAMVLFALAAWHDRRVIAVVLVVAYVYPVLMWYVRGVASIDFNVLWIAALFGAILPDLLRTPWRLPTRWRGALILSGFVVAVAVPIALWREVDGHLYLYLGPRIAYNWSEPYWFFARWAMYLAVPLAVGLLFFESLFAGAVRIESAIAPALLVSATLMAAVAAYQRLIDQTFLNGTMFEVFERATGTMYDANVMGMIAALSLGGVGLWASGNRRRMVVGVPAACLLSVALWASGSRTAFVAGTAILLSIGLAAFLSAHRLTARLVAAYALAVLLLVASAMAYGATHPEGHNPVSRLWGMVAGYPTPGALAEEIWRRNGYGTVATEMIKESPVSGVGVGAFNTLTEETAVRLGFLSVSDNAQNWLRQQVAEFGFVGALGWIVWTVLFAVFVLRVRHGEAGRIWIARTTLIAFGLISFVGMPSQNPMVAITFWVFVYWYCQLADENGSASATARWTWPVVAALVAVFIASSVVVAQTSLRLPERARRARTGFSYGFGPVMSSPDQAGYRSINADAAMLLEPESPWMTISLRRTASDRAAAPVDVRILADGQALLKAQLDINVPFTTTVQVPVNRGPILIEARVRDVAQYSIALSPLTDVTVRWEFGSDARAGAHQYERR